MKKIYFTFLSAALLLGGCNKGIDGPEMAGHGEKPISFRTWTEKQTRSGAVTQTDDITSFVVSAWVKDRMPSVDGLEPTVLINGATATGNNTDGWSYGSPAFWDESNLINFYAYTPAVSKGVNGTPLEADVSTDAIPAIEYTLPGHSESSEAIADQEDLLVAVHQGSMHTEYASGVPLTFRHALSRIVVQAKSEGTNKFVVTSVKLKNLKGSGKLNLGTLPRDGVALPYATDADLNYATYWTDLTDNGDLEVDFEEVAINGTQVKGVSIDGTTYQNVTDDEHALYVIPQANEASDLAAAVKGANNPSSKFFIEISYYEHYGDNGTTPDGPLTTYAVPVPAIVGSPSTSSIAFEMQKQYTFQFELIGSKPIVLKSVTAQDWTEVAPPQELPLKLTWAGSNIYYDETLGHLTFADAGDKSKEQYQGLYFKWGSLTGISPMGNYNAAVTLTYPPTGGIAETSPAYVDIPYVDADPGSYERTARYLTDVAYDPSTGVGDICKYMTEKGWAPKGKRWRMPTSQEFEPKESYVRVPDLATMPTFEAVMSEDAAGKFIFDRGYDRGGIFFPAAGNRDTAGALGYVGVDGHYWSGSASSVTYGFNLGFNSTGVSPALNGSRSNGFPVRCVAE